MKMIYLAAALSTAFMSTLASAETLQLSLDPTASIRSVSLDKLLPANFVATSASLRVYLGTPGFEFSAPVLGSYELQEEVLQGATCPSSAYLFCESVTQNYLRESVSKVTPMDISATLVVGSQSVDGDSSWMSATLRQKQAGATAIDSSSSHGEDVVFGYQYDPSGQAQPILVYRETISNYSTQDVTLFYSKPELSLDLSFDQASLAALNAGRSFDYQLMGSYVLMPARAVLEIEGGVSPVPEPASAAMLLPGLGMLGWMARRRRTTAA